jgi:hypothetical protein
MEMMRRRLRTIFAICLVSLLIAGCVHTIEITDHQIKAGKIKAGTSYTAPMDGWFVSDEGIAKILQAIEYYKFKWQECEASK